MGIYQNRFFVGAALVAAQGYSKGQPQGLPLRLILLLVLSLGLSGCKIELNIFGTGTVESVSGSLDCSNNDPDSANQTGDCLQEYVTAMEDCDGYGVPAHDEWAELPNCTLVTEEAPITETLLASPAENDSFDGWDDGCIGAGGCDITIDSGDADDQEAVMNVEAHFDEELPPEDAIYTYNYLGQRVSKTVNGVITYFVYDEAGNLLSEIDGNNSTTNDIKSHKNYVYLEGEYVAHVEQTGDTGDSEAQAQIFYPLNDHLGQPFVLVRADAQISHEQYTDPFGKMHAQYLNTSIGTGPESQNRRLPGQYYDQETGLHYNYQRYYDPAFGYTQPDKLDVLGRTNDPELMMANMMGAAYWDAGPNHLYGYANQNPVIFVDPYGLATQVSVGVGAHGQTGAGGYGPGGAAGGGTSLGVSIPDDPMQWKCYQFFLSFGAYAGGGFGTFFGVGGTANMASSDGPISSGTSRSMTSTSNAGTGSVSGGVTFTLGPNGPTGGGGGIDTGSRGSLGFGIGAATSVNGDQTYTFATPPFGDDCDCQ